MTVDYLHSKMDLFRKCNEDWFFDLKKVLNNEYIRNSFPLLEKEESKKAKY